MRTTPCWISCPSRLTPSARRSRISGSAWPSSGLSKWGAGPTNTSTPRRRGLRGKLILNAPERRCTCVAKSFARWRRPWRPLCRTGPRHWRTFSVSRRRTGGPDGGEDAWERAKQPLPSGAELKTPVVLFPKIDKDYIAELAELHMKGGAF